MEAMIRYGILTVFASAVTADCDCVFVRMNAAPITGVTTAPIALKDCARFKRRSADPAGPSTVT